MHHKNRGEESTILKKAQEVKERIEKELLKLPGVQGVDVGYKIVHGEKTDCIAIRVYVATKGERPEKERIPAEIEGIPTDVIERRIVLQDQK